MFRKLARGVTKRRCRKSECQSIIYLISAPFALLVALTAYLHFISLCYYFSDLERLLDPHYLPNEQDIAHCRALSPA